MTTSASPIETKERAIILDVLRGFALVGVVIANFTGFTDQQVPVDILNSISSPFDKTLTYLNRVLIEWKFMTLFSILFGYGFGLLIASLERKNINPSSFIVQRMFWLFLIGFIHSSFWWFDVLHMYAICGVLLLFFRKVTDRAILILSTLFILLAPLCYSLLMHGHDTTFNEADSRLIYEQFKYGSLIDLFGANLVGYYKLFILSASDVTYTLETLGRFLFGYYLVRKRMFESIHTKRNFFSKIVRRLSPVVLAYFVLTILTVTEMINISSVYWSLLMNIGIFATTLFYSSIIILGYISFGENRLFRSLQLLGKMTLTNYLLVTAINITVLYGIGFGQLGELPMHTIWLLAFGWLLIEILISFYWLRSFSYGPVEWIWRQLNYWKRIPLRK